MPKKNRSLLDSFERAFQSIEEEAFEVIEEKEITESRQSSVSRGLSRQSITGHGYEITVRKEQRKPALIMISSDSEVTVIVNGKTIVVD